MYGTEVQKENKKGPSWVSWKIAWKNSKKVISLVTYFVYRLLLQGSANEYRFNLIEMKLMIKWMYFRQELTFIPHFSTIYTANMCHN